jgi:hypothetical protein
MSSRPSYRRVLDEQIVALALRGMMLATNVFNNALEVDPTNTWSRTGRRERA